ncbi:hypothetical protein BKA64DRAFT_704703 [Cadophora sp. MPI-SDFR-AT-0126]|nr:hypothetical protein BKA64DRAFT_704703 [Leotiomycetes sp. MPI-SDFR-AT-0126]
MKFLLALAMLIGRDLSSGGGGNGGQPVGWRGSFVFLDDGTLVDLGESNSDHASVTVAIGEANLDSQPPEQKRTRKRKGANDGDEDEPEQQPKKPAKPKEERDDYGLIRAPIKEDELRAIRDGYSVTRPRV